MGWNDRFGHSGSGGRRVICRCGAKYDIYEDDGTPGCRDIETVNCEFCGVELARHFGTCDGTLADDRGVSKSLKAARKEYDEAVRAYVQKHGHNWGTDEYAEILERWHDAVKRGGSERR